MPQEKDPRRVVGAAIHTKVTSVISLAECCRLYGAFSKSKKVNGTVQEVLVDDIKGRLSTSLRVKWVLVQKPIQKTKIKTVKIINVKAGKADEDSRSSRMVVSSPSRQNSVLRTPAYSTRGRTSSSPNAEFSVPMPTSTPEGHTNHNASKRSSERPMAGSLAYALQGSWDQASQEDLDVITLDPVPSAFVHGVPWFERQVLCPIGGRIPRQFWNVRTINGDVISENCGIGLHTPYECFMTMFPQMQLRKIVAWTSVKLKRIGRNETTVTELLKFFGILVLMKRFEFRAKRDLWMSTRPNKYIPAPSFSNSGMNRDMFSEYLRCITFSVQPSEQGTMSSAQHRLALVQDFFDAINDHRKLTVSPSDLICVDESISRWYGNGGHWIDIWLPQYIAIDRKPESGCEIQNSACGRSGIMLHLELVTTAEDEKQKDFEDEIVDGTAVLRRLVAAYSGTRRIVCPDSYFASVESAEMLLRLGLKFIGVIKTATKKYPMEYLSQVELSERGQCVSMVRKSLTGDPLMMAAMWVDRDGRYFISNTSTTMQGKPYRRVRWRQLEDGASRVELSVPQPEVCATYYSACAQIDRHNRCCQEILDMEKKVRTQDWSFRVNISLLAICVVDSWLLFSGAHQESQDHMTQQRYYETLAEQLIDNSFDSRNIRQRLVSPKRKYASGSGVGTHLTPTKKKNKTSAGMMTTFAVQNNCRVCQVKKTTLVCSSCNRLDGAAVYICGTSTGRNCFAKHVEHIHVLDAFDEPDSE